MATEKFQQLISQVIAGCAGAYNMSDDIIVVGESQSEHNQRLAAVIQRLSEHGLTLNGKKCLIGQASVEYMGHLLTDDGLKVTQKKVEAIRSAPAPTKPSEVWSFLGLAQFSAKFMPGFATTSSPLWELTKQDTEWKWTQKEQKAFDQVKAALSKEPVMAYFTQGLPIRITTDASPFGLGAILEQEHGGEYRPVYYASRKVTPTESRYSQFEREGLAVFWACKKFYLYLIGNEFEIRTDNKALVSALCPESKPSSARIERWILYLQQFKYCMTHTPGESNPADALSRLPIPSSPTPSNHVSTESFVYSVVKDAVPVAIDPRHIESESEKDEMLQEVRNAIAYSDWRKLKGTLYKALREELWTAGKLVMRGSRIVMPASLWEHTLNLAHEGHQGAVRTKSRLREKVW
jgi:hypothetical protein